MAKDSVILTDIVTIPTVWMTYQVPGNTMAILGNTATMPPQIVLEHMVAKGLAKRLGTVTTFEANGIEDDDDDEENESKDNGPWLKDDDDD